ncbi:MAG: ABC transporter ATP-binding protein, partial [Firmicutes bacterium]|nr:ABC transporter ATP-binding protein [Bacillota bacterium]
GRALMARPVLLCLDEPSMGLSPALTQDLFSALEAINQTGTAILLVEQNVNLALEFAQRAYVLEAGQVVLQGTGEELLADSRVRGAYLGDR